MVQGLKPNLKRLNSIPETTEKKIANAKALIRRLRATEYPVVKRGREITALDFEDLLEINADSSHQDKNLYLWYNVLYEKNRSNQGYQDQDYVDFYLTALIYYVGHSGRNKEARFCFEELKDNISACIENLEIDIEELEGELELAQRRLDTLINQERLKMGWV